MSEAAVSRLAARDLDHHGYRTSPGTPTYEFRGRCFVFPVRLGRVSAARLSGRAAGVDRHSRNGNMAEPIAPGEKKRRAGGFCKRALVGPIVPRVQARGEV